MGVYGPHTQVKHLFKSLDFSHMYRGHNHIFPDKISIVSVTSCDSYRPSKWQKVHKLGLRGQLRDFKVTLKLKLDLRISANLYPPERQLTKASEPSFDLEGGAQGQI